MFPSPSGPQRPRSVGACAARPAGTPAAAISLIPETLAELESDEELQQLHERVAREGQAALTRKERQQRQRSLDALGVPPFYSVVARAGSTPLVRSSTAVFQLNIGLYCNQACRHCHVESSPK
jgi:hypothetical protein